MRDFGSGLFIGKRWLNHQQVAKNLHFIEMFEKKSWRILWRVFPHSTLGARVSLKYLTKLLFVSTDSRLRLWNMLSVICYVGLNASEGERISRCIRVVHTEEQRRDLWRQFCLILDGKDRSALTRWKKSGGVSQMVQITARTGVKVDLNIWNSRAKIGLNVWDFLVDLNQ